MQIFQSWADIVIMAVIAIAYILTFIAQKNQIRILKGNIKAHSDLTNSQSVHIAAYTSLFDLDKLEKLKNSEIKIALSEINKKKTETENELIKITEENQNLKIYLVSVLWHFYDILKASKEERKLHMEKYSKEFVDKNTYNLAMRGFAILDIAKEEIQDTPS